MKAAWVPVLLLFYPVALYGMEDALPAGMLRSVLAAAAMLAVLLAVAWIARRMSGPRLDRPGGEGRIRLLSQKPLGMREKLVLVEVDGARVLLGITQNNIQRLHLVDSDPGAIDSATTRRHRLEQD